MKFISKQSNYRATLRPGQSPEQATGRLGVPGLYAYFQDSVLDVQDEEMLELMLKHDGFNKDFIVLEEGQVDPWKDSRRNKEPEHTHTEMEYGHVGKVRGSRAPTLSPDQKVKLRKMAEGMATEMAKEMAPKLAKEILENLAKTKVASAGASKPKGRPKGRGSTAKPKESKALAEEQEQQVEMAKGGMPKPGTAPIPIESEEPENPDLPEETVATGTPKPGTAPAPIESEEPENPDLPVEMVKETPASKK